MIKTHNVYALPTKVYASLVVTVFVLLSSDIIARSEIQRDSTLDNDTVNHSKAPRKSTTRLTLRMHSLGLFGYAGAIANDNPAADVNFTYERKTWGVMLIKALDLYDLHSDYNFSLAMAYKNFKLSKHVTFAPYAGFAFEQEHSLADAGSDGMAFLITTYRFNKQLAFEHCARFSGFIVEPDGLDWLNRMRLIYTRNHLDIIAIGWHNNGAFDHSHYTTVGLNVGLSRIDLSGVMLSTGVTTVLLAESSAGEEFHREKGLVFTIAATFQ